MFRLLPLPLRPRVRESDAYDDFLSHSGLTCTNTSCTICTSLARLAAFHRTSTSDIDISASGLIAPDMNAAPDAEGWEHVDAAEGEPDVVSEGETDVDGESSGAISPWEGESDDEDESGSGSGSPPSSDGEEQVQELDNPPPVITFKPSLPSKESEPDDEDGEGGQTQGIPSRIPGRTKGKVGSGAGEVQVGPASATQTANRESPTWDPAGTVIAGAISFWGVYKGKKAREWEC
ncbi:uncharacterized protein DSM5745_02698 [Aspergillus mulundensis]|uniref:Uncharacterized protein n=1 Tax=Aspergillus mulundensis TaxID=1810919 RepID=A0A3D8SID5_9EURO|nr:hypothetical protein DSM5745_02698 [Aspergillus mulundensis]RDW86056.1 hypothetical protein DSM5745_02698 [Aspergillus mulundensis]